MDMEKKFAPVAVADCADYEEARVREALRRVIALAGGLSWVREGMRIAVKANMVAGGKPESAVTTHPRVLTELCRILSDMDAVPVVGDSPGGLFNAAFVGGVYKASGMRMVEEAGGVLNEDFSEERRANPDGKIAKSLECTAWLFSCDAIINVCKLKTHGMMSMSAAVKNMFGSVPGTIKPEYHFRFPNENDFADMLIDIDEFYRPRLHIVDAVTGMEGNGPTAGTPRHVGALLASVSPYPLDAVCGKLIGLSVGDVPTLAAAARRGLGPESADSVELLGDKIEPFMLSDYELVRERSRLAFTGRLGGLPGRLLGKLFGKALESRPAPESALCVSCAKCRDVCPAKAISMQGEKPLPVIDRGKCIKCFCCQEFCPVGAMKVKRSPLARLLNRGGGKS